MRHAPDDLLLEPPDPALRDAERLAAVRTTGLMGDAPSPLLDQVAAEAARLLDAPVALVSLVDDRRQRFAGRAAARGPIANTRETPLAYSLCQHVVARRAPFAVADAAGDPRVRDHPAVRDLGVRAYAGVPLTTAGGATLGALCAIDDAPHAWTPDDLARLRGLATVAVAELERRAEPPAERQTDGGREHDALRLAADGAADGLWSWDLADGTAFYSTRLRELLGTAPDELPDRAGALERLVHPDDLAAHREAVRAHLARKGPYAAEVRLRHHDGGWRWFQLRGRAAWGVDGRATHLAGSATDVTERRAAEAALQENQAHLAQLFARATVGLCELSMDGRFLRVNAELCRIVGRSPEEAAALAFTDVTHPDDVARSVAAVSGVLVSGGSVRLEKRYLRPDGTAVVAESVITRLDAKAGQPPTLLAVTADLTARRAAEAALRESEARFRQLADHVSEMFWLFEAGPTLDESRVLYVNPAYARITGRPVEGARALPALSLDLVAPEDRPRARAAAHAVLGGEEQEVEYRLEAAGGAPKVVRTRMFPIRDADGRVVRVGGLTEDVTEQRTLEDRLRQAQKMEAVGQMAGGIAHDFNNLLTVISANLEFVREALAEELPADHPAAGDLAGIADAAARARTLVRQLLAFGRKQPTQPRPVRLGALVRGAEGLLRRALGEEITLRVEVPDDVTVDADPGQLEQVLLNLAVNGRDAMLTPRHGHPGTGGTLSILVDAAPRAHGGAAGRRWARLRVCDTGHGMDAATQAHLFEPFFTTKEVGAGTGLGLASAHGIVSQAGGTIQVESAPGAGTVFTVLLPAVADASARPAAAVPAGPGGRPPASGTVLLVEDEAPVRATVRRMLERAGYAVREAAHGRDALAVWAAHRDEVVAVLTDVRMPAMGGPALAERLRAEAPGLPVVFMSGYTDDAPEAGRGAPGAFVAKPFVSEAILAALRQALGVAPGA